MGKLHLSFERSDPHFLRSGDEFGENEAPRRPLNQAREDLSFDELPNRPGLAQTGACASPPEPPRVIILDREGPLRDALCTDFRRSSYEVVVEDDVERALQGAAALPPALVVTEIRLRNDHREGLAFLGALLDRMSSVPVVVVSDFLSVAITVWAIRRGATAVLPKPTSSRQILDSVGANTPPSALGDSQYFSLQRATREYIMQCVCECGSLAAAARRLGVQPRSLRRMIARNAPIR
jgi:two-component system response regulator RegA